MALQPIIQNFLTSVDTTIGNFILGGAANVGTVITPIFRILVTLFVVLWGIAIWRGLIQEPMSDGVARILKIVLIGTFALSAAVYGTQVATTIYKTPERLANAVRPSSGSGAASALDAAMDKTNTVAAKFSSAAANAGPFDALALYFYAATVLLAGVLIIGYALALVLLAKLGLAIVLALGPIFIALLLFEATRTFFQGWLAQALNFLFTYVLVVLAVSLALSFLDDAANITLQSMPAGSDPDLVAALPFFLVGIATFIVLKQTPGIASGLAGGVQLSTLGAVGWAMRSGGRALGAPARAWGAFQRHRDRNLMRQYYRSQIAATPAPTPTPAGQNDGWIKARLRGQNSVTRK